MSERRSFARLGLEQLESREVPTAHALSTPPELPPNAPLSFAATALSGSRVKLTWADVAGEDGYRIYQWTGSAWAVRRTVGADVTKLVVGHLSAGWTYYFYVEAFNAAGAKATDFVGVTTAPPPSVPGSFTATALSGTQVRLNWADSTGEDGYRIYQWTGKSWVNVGTEPADATSHVVSGLSAGRTYYFYVEAFNAAGASAAHFVSVATAAPPPAPAGFAATAISRSQVLLSWGDVAGENGYRVYQWTGSAWAFIGANGPNVTSFLVSGLASNRAYYFYVDAFNDVGSTAALWQGVVTPFF